MLDAIKSFFKSSMTPPAHADASRKDIRLAACALLVELAHADDQFTDAEREELSRKNAEQNKRSENNRR